MRKNTYAVVVFQKNSKDTAPQVQKLDNSEWVRVCESYKAAETVAKQLATTYPQYCVQFGRLTEQIEVFEPFQRTYLVSVPEEEK